MEVQLQQGSPNKDSKQTFRSVKPPDQCVISYNFEHANTLNFTHNMLIGIGLQEPSRKGNSELSTANKQRLFSIIPQPKKVFRNEASSVGKAQSAAILPKRYVPSSSKTRFNQNYSQYASGEEREKTNNEKSSYTQERSLLAVAAERELIQLADFNSPSSTLGKKKSQKSNLSKNQKKSMIDKSHTTSKAAISSKIQNPKYQNQLSKEQEGRVEQLNGNVFDDKLIKEVSEDKESQSNLQDNKFSNYQNVGQVKGPNKTHAVTYSQGSFMKNHHNSTLTIKPEHTSKQELPQSNVSIQAQQTITKGAKINDSNIESQKQAFRSQQLLQKGQDQTLRLHKNSNNNQQQFKTKSKKQIQDEQLQQLQTKIRKEEAGKFKKGFFRVSSNKEKQVLPFQASIQPIFTNNKHSFSQLPHKTSNSRNNSVSNINNNNHQMNHLKTDSKKTFDQLPRTSNGFNNINNFNLTNPSHNPKINTINTQILNMTAKKDSTIKPNKVNSPIKNIILIKQEQNTIKNPSIKRQTNNLTAVTSTQKIKRSNQDITNRLKIDKNDMTQNVKTANNEHSQDLTVNNQIKGFKVPQKAVPSNRNNNSSLNSKFIANNNKGSEKTSNEQQRYSEAAPNIRSRKTDIDDGTVEDKSYKLNKKRQNVPRGNQSAIVNDSKRSNLRDKQNGKPLKPTISRQSKDKDYKFKKWRDAEPQQVQKKSRDSKQREQSNVSRERQSKRSQLRKMKQKSSKIIDLDAQQEDKFGLLSMRKGNSNKKQNKNKHKTKKINAGKGINNVGVYLNEEQEVQNSQNSQNKSNYYQQEVNQEKLKQNRNDLEEQQQKLMEEDLMDENLQKISSIHSSKITEQDEEGTEQQQSQQDRKSLPPKKNLQQLLKATEESPSPNKHQQLPVYIQLDNSIIADPVINKNAEQNVIDEQNQKQEKQYKRRQEKMQKQSKNQQQQALFASPIYQNANEQAMIESSKQDLDKINKSKEQNHENTPFLVSLQPDINRVSKEAQKNNQKAEKIQRKTSNMMKTSSPQANTTNKQQDFFEYNIKQMSKFNETVNQTFNITKYETFDRDLAEYTRAPILSFIYGHSQQILQTKNVFIPSAQRTSLLDQSSLGQTAGEELIDQAINIFLSIDHWIIQRIFEPFLNINQEIGVWLYWHGRWQLLQVKGDNYRTALRNAITKIALEKGIQCSLQIVLRLISGVRVAKLKSSKKRVLSELDYSLNKKHVLKAVTSKDSKWGERMFEVVKVQISKQGGNVLKLKQRSQYFWVKQQKFQQIFQHFLLICIRASHFWTTTSIASKQSHKSVVNLSSEAPVHGSVTLFYPSQQKSSLSFYKQLQSKVLKYMGRIEQKANQNGNLYFQFRMNGTYYLFLETPADCQLAIQSTSKLIIGQPEYIVSQTLKNDKCEYVEIEHAKNSSRPTSKHLETLEKLREKFINMVSTK